jgi:RNA polymerase sigma-70 factor, ECF subfamily
MDQTPRQAKKLARKHQSFAALYKIFALPLMKFLVKKMGGNQQAAEEVFSRTIVAAWEGWHTFENKSSYFTWVCRIGLNKMADYYREQVHQRSVLVVPTLETLANIKDKGLLPEEKLALMELRASIRECLAILPPEKRRLIYLRFWQELTIKKIAGILGISERAAEGQLYRAKLTLKEVISTKRPELINVAAPPKNPPFE